MRKAENVNAPWLGGFLIGAASGLVAFGVAVVVGKFDLFPAAAIGALVAAVSGLFLGMPWGAARKPVFDAKSAAMPAAKVADLAKPVQSKPVKDKPVGAAGMAQPAAVMSAPVAKAKAPAAPKVKAAPKAKAATKPKPAAKPKVAKPAGLVRLKGPRKGGAEDLKEIEGIGPALEKLVNELGFYHFDQIAGWSDADVALVDAEMKTFKGRITRDKWVAQAKIIVADGLDAFRIRAKTNDY